MMARTARWPAACVLTACVAATTWADNPSPPAAPLPAEVSAAGPAVPHPGQPIVARYPVESLQSPFTPAHVAGVALLVFAVIAGLLITFRSLRNDLRSRRRVYRRRAHRSANDPGYPPLSRPNN